MTLQSWGGRAEAWDKEHQHVNGQCCAQGNTSGSTNQTTHSMVEVPAASPITRNKNPGPRPAHSSPWSAQPPPPITLPHHSGFFWFSKVPPQPSMPLLIPGLGIPVPQVFHDACITLKLQPVPSHCPSQTTHTPGCVLKHSGGTNFSLPLL